MYYKRLKFLNEWIYVARDEIGITFIGGPYDDFDDMKRFLKCDDFEENKEVFADLISYLGQYMLGNASHETLSLHMIGTDFQKDVWHVLQSIPYGDVWTYTQVADALGKPKAVRAVASAIGKNPLMILVPCHRVNGKDGSLRGFRGGLEMKGALQALESNKT